ncbi:hypothetical protein AB9E13_35205, partial [Rhizobium leguminosarum]
TEVERGSRLRAAVSMSFLKSSSFTPSARNTMAIRGSRRASVGNMIGALANRANLQAMPCFG